MRGMEHGHYIALAMLSVFMALGLIGAAVVAGAWWLWRRAH